MQQTAPAPVEVVVPPALMIRTSRRCNTADQIAGAMGDAFAALTAYAGRHALQCAGPPRAIYTSWGAQGTEFTVAMPIPVPGSPALPEEGVSVATIPGGHMLRFTHTGRYDEVAGTYEQIAHWLRDAGLMKTEADWSRFMPMWEEYLNDPNSTPASELLTYIYLPKH